MQRYGLGIMVVWWACLGMALAVEPSQLSPTEMVRGAPLLCPVL